MSTLGAGGRWAPGSGRTGVARVELDEIDVALVVAGGLHAADGTQGRRIVHEIDAESARVQITARATARRVLEPKTGGVPSPSSSRACPGKLAATEAGVWVSTSRGGSFRRFTKRS